MINSFNYVSGLSLFSLPQSVDCQWRASSGAGGYRRLKREKEMNIFWAAFVKLALLFVYLGV